MKYHATQSQVIQRFDQQLAQFRAKYEALNDVDRQQVRAHLLERQQQVCGNESQTIANVHLCTDADGTIRSVTFHPIIYLAAIAAWEDGSDYAPSTDDLLSSISLN